MTTKKIILAIMPLWGIDHPPLGIAYLTANLELYGYTVTQKDYCMDMHLTYSQTQDMHMANPAGKDHQHIYKHYIYIFSEIQSYLDRCAIELAYDDAGIIGFTVLFSNIYTILDLARKIKDINPQKIIVLGGPGVEERYADYRFIDYLVYGEAEGSMVMLMDALNGRGNLHEVPGLVYRQEAGVIKIPPGPVNKDLDSLPFPVFRDFFKQPYLRKCIPILASRGCINKCTFCSEYRLSPFFRTRSAGNIVEEIKYQQHLYPGREFVFMDSLINGSLPVLNRMCDLLIESNLDITWVAKASIRKQMTAGLFEKMHRSGCKSLMFGVESGSPSVLRDMNKPYTIEIAERVLRAASQAGIIVQLFFVIGFPTESEANFRETLEFVGRNQNYIGEIIPGEGCLVEKNSDLYDNYTRYGIYWQDIDNCKNADNWYSEQTSPSVRKERVRRFYEYVSSTRIKIVNWSTEANMTQKYEISPTGSQ